MHLHPPDPASRSLPAALPISGRVGDASGVSEAVTAVSRPHVQINAAHAEGVHFAVQLLNEPNRPRSEEHTSELQARGQLVGRLRLEKKSTEAERGGRSADVDA